MAGGRTRQAKKCAEGVCARARVCTCMQAGQGLLKGRAIEREHKKGGGLRRQEEDTLRAKLPLFRAGPTCLLERFPYPAKVQEEEASLCASQDSDLVGQRWGPAIYPFKMAFWVAATERSSTEPL